VRSRQPARGSQDQGRTPAEPTPAGSPVQRQRAATVLPARGRIADTAQIGPSYSPSGVNVLTRVRPFLQLSQPTFYSVFQRARKPQKLSLSVRDSGPISYKLPWIRHQSTIQTASRSVWLFWQCVQQTHRPRYTCNNGPHSHAIMRCKLTTTTTDGRPLDYMCICLNAAVTEYLPPPHTSARWVMDSVMVWGLVTVTVTVRVHTFVNW